MIRVLFFGEIKEKMGCDAVSILFKNDLTVERVAASLFNDRFKDKTVTEHLMYAVNQEQVSADTKVLENDEVAIMSAFAGG